MNLFDTIFKQSFPERTAILYEQRQISYAEIWVTEHCWPEFREADLHQAIRDFAGRDRRFGGLSG